MKAFLKKYGPYVLAFFGAIVTFFVGKSVSKSAVKTEMRTPVRVKIPDNVRELSTASNLNQVVAEFTER